MRPRALVHVVISLAPGGLEKLVVDWTNARNARYPGSTTVVCLDEPGALAVEVEGNAVCCLSTKRGRFPWDMAAVEKLRSEIRRQNQERGTKNQEHSSTVLHSHNLAAQQYAVLAALGTGVKHVHTQHGANVHNQGVRDRLRSRLLGCFTDRSVAVSDSVADSMARQQWIPRRRITVIPNGVSPHPETSPDEIERLRQSLKIPHGVTVIGSIGRLAQVKGYDRLLKAFAELVRGGQGTVNSEQLEGGSEKERVNGEQYLSCNLPHPTSHFLLLVGDGPERGTLERQTRELGISPNVVFAGFQSDARKFLDLMDVFILPSHSEGLSVALLEAMAAGVPVAVTDVGENRRVLDDGRAGVLLPDDEAQWAAAIQSELTVISSEQAGQRVQRAKQRVGEHYSFDATLAAYERLYVDLL